MKIWRDKIEPAANDYIWYRLNSDYQVTGKFKYKDGKWVLFKANDNEIDTSSFATVATSGDYNDLINKPNVQGFERESNKITTISENATDTQYPSAKSVYDIIVENERVISNAINDLNDRVNELNQKITNEGV